VHLKKGMSNLDQDSDIMIDQIRAIGNKRLIRKIRVLPEELVGIVKRNLRIVMDLNQ
jgi:mRNA interferase MazF